MVCFCQGEVYDLSKPKEPKLRATLVISRDACTFFMIVFHRLSRKYHSICCREGVLHIYFSANESTDGISNLLQGANLP